MIFVDENIFICVKRIKRIKGFLVCYKCCWGGSCEIFVFLVVEKMELGEKLLCCIEIDLFYNIWLLLFNMNFYDVL